MKKALFLSIFILLVSLGIHAQTYKGIGRITGRVLDAQGNPVEGVKVKLFSVRGQAGFEVTTDGEGKWVASWLRGGAWNIDFEKIGFTPKQITIEIEEYGKKPPPIEVRMDKAEGLIITEELKAALTEGNTLFDEGKYQESIEVYKNILVGYPDAYIINKNIGNAFFQMEKYDEAEEYYQNVLVADPNNNEALMLIGNCYANRGDNDKALEWYNRLDFEKINEPTVLYNIGTIYYNLAKFQEALKYYKRAVEIKEDFPDGIYQLGLTYLTLEAYKDSIAVFERYLKHDAESERAIQVKSFIEFLKSKIETERPS